MSRARIPFVVLAAVLPIVALTALLADPVPSDPRSAPIALSADPVVTSAIEETAASDDAGTLEVVSGLSPENARALVEDGTFVAALTVDLEAPDDVLYLAGANGTRVNDAVAAAVEDVLQPFERDVVVQDVHPADVPQHLPGWLVAAGLLAGAALTLTRQWGGRLLRRSRSPRHDAEIIGTDSLLYGVLLGGAAFLAGLPGWPPAWIALGFLLVTIAATVTAAALRSIGGWGFGLVAALFVVPTWVLARAPHPLLLPDLIDAVGRWMPHGAAAEIAGRLALFGDGAAARPWFVLMGWAVAGGVALAVTRGVSRPQGSVEPAAVEG